jgi:patatin-like phospholipase/acyl hydrolase
MTFKILCIDGGGVRGIILAQILYNIEHDLGIKIYDYFDMFSGTSSGSMVIGCLVYGKVTCEKLVSEVMTNKNLREIMSQTLFDKLFGNLQMCPKYNGHTKRRLIEKVVGNKTINIEEQLPKYVMIPSFNATMNTTRFFKSWKDESLGIRISKIIDASSAAPSYYPSVEIDNNDYIDGGISVNNPTSCAYADALKLSNGEVIQILSIGTGYRLDDSNDNTRNWGGIQWATIGEIFSIIMESPSQIVDYQTNVFASSLGHEYLRIDGPIENDRFDDTSDVNLDLMRAIGDEWYLEYKDQLVEFFEGDFTLSDRSSTAN